MWGLNYIVRREGGHRSVVSKPAVQGETDWFLAKFVLFCKCTLEKPTVEAIGCRLWYSTRSKI